MELLSPSPQKRSIPSFAVDHLDDLICIAAFSALLLITPGAQALDGCRVLLCLAAPDWSAIPQCVPPIEELLADLADGDAFPTCDMSGAGNGASNQWASAPANCPPQYTVAYHIDIYTAYRCEYTGAIEVDVNGTLWSTTWWSMHGNTVTDFSPTAKAQLGTWNTQFDDDYAAWLAAQSAPANP
jgi:hypothetical protein